MFDYNLLNSLETFYIKFVHHLNTINDCLIAKKSTEDCYKNNEHSIVTQLFSCPSLVCVYMLLNAYTFSREIVVHGSDFNLCVLSKSNYLILQHYC